MGIPVSGKNLFPSNIAGLPTWYTIRANKAGWVARKKEIDILVAMNPETAREDVLSLAPGGVAIYDEPLNLSSVRGDVTFYPVPFDKLTAAVCPEAKLRKLVKKDELQFEPLDLDQLIRDVARLLHSDTVIRKVRIVLHSHAESRMVRGDAVQLQQVLLNLLLNAFDAMKDVEEDDRIVTVRTRQIYAGSVQIAVSDRGTGIDPQRLARLFEPFQTSKPEGLGLGLSICRSIVEGHGGRLWAENNPDRGATFCFTVPVDPRVMKPDDGQAFRN